MEQLCCKGKRSALQLTLSGRSISLRSLFAAEQSLIPRVILRGCSLVGCLHAWLVIMLTKPRAVLIRPEILHSAMHRIRPEEPTRSGIHAPEVFAPNWR